MRKLTFQNALFHVKQIFITHATFELYLSLPDNEHNAAVTNY